MLYILNWIIEIVHCTSQVKAKLKLIVLTANSWQMSYNYNYNSCYSRKHKSTGTAEVNATHDLEMASEGLDDKQVPHGDGPMYANTEFSLQPNPSYVYRMVN